MTSSIARTASPESILRATFGYPEFRDNQRRIIGSLVDGCDVFALMPTGSGKSLCYQIPSLIRDGVGVVISPLIALMQDQVADLRQNGVRAAFLNSSLESDEALLIEDLARKGDCDLLYVAPERLLSDRFQRLLSDMNIALFAIDEAHCVSQWGHDFRPEYLQIAEVTNRFPDVPRIALTATADMATRAEIVDKLQLRDPDSIVASFDRPNIYYRIRLKDKDKQQLLTILRERHVGNSGIVYVRTRKRVNSISSWLADQGFTALPYHAGLPADERSRNQHRFLMEDGVIMVATVAFGMGIDKPDVRFVAHLDLPSSMEAYYQETGRAGRDGEPAEAWLFYSMADVVAMRNLQNLSDGNEAFRSVQQRKLNAFLGFCESPECRRKGLLEYFGEVYPGPCERCDNCTESVDTWDGTVVAQKALSAVYRTGQRFGAAYLIDVLTGNTTTRMEQFGHDQLPTFGVGSDLDPQQWHSVFRQLLAAGFLDMDLASRRGFRLNKNSKQILSGSEAVHFRTDPQPVRKSSGGSKRTKSRRGKTGDDKFDSNDPSAVALWEALRQLRYDIATELNVPPYVVFHDKTLRAMIEQRPHRKDDLLNIVGIGEAKLKRFGDQFFALLKQSER